MLRDYYDFERDGKVVAEIDKTYADEISVKLPCGYHQRFWMDYSDEEAVKVCEKMKADGIESS